MPFNWDTSRLEKQNIFVHEEIHFPTSFKEFSQAGTYKASVNGFPVTGRMLIADPYSMDNTLILHFLLSKENILDIIRRDFVRAFYQIQAVVPSVYRRA